MVSVSVHSDTGTTKQFYHLSYLHVYINARCLMAEHSVAVHYCEKYDTFLDFHMYDVSYFQS